METNIPQKGTLSKEQIKIVNHKTGPAHLLACAGSGKTTILADRANQLVKKDKVLPESILILLGNQELAVKMHDSLNEMGVQNVNCEIFHSLGYAIIQEAYNRKHISYGIDNTDFEKIHKYILSKSIEQFIEMKKVTLNSLNIDFEELENQLSVWKGNLFYPERKKGAYHKKVLKDITQAKYYNNDYVEIYKIYDKIATEEKLITYDYILSMSWEVLMSYPDVLEFFQNKYEFVMVDDFQNINKVEYLLINLLVDKHKNVLVVGDDDQHLYEQKGTAHDFLYKFEKDYKSRKYMLSENFRSSIKSLMFANTLIANNRARHKKTSSLTKGFTGQANVKSYPSVKDEAIGIINEIEALARKGQKLSSIAILLRNFSQAIFLEVSLISRKIPFSLSGNKPFYQRDEIVVLLKYLAWVNDEINIKENGFPKDDLLKKRYIDRFKYIVNVPTRHFQTHAIDDICNKSIKNSLLISDLVAKKQTVSSNKFLDIIFGLMKRIKKNELPYNLLKWLIDEMNYKEHILFTTGIREKGLSKLKSIESFLEFTKKFKTIEELLDCIITESKHEQSDNDSIKIMTIQQAQGLEWESVFIPSLNKGVFPYGTEDSTMDSVIGLTANREEERRLLYIGITRASDRLYLSFDGNKDISPFITEIAPDFIVDRCDLLERVINKLNTRFSKNDMINIIDNIVLLNLDYYFSNRAIFQKLEIDKIKKSLEKIKDSIEELQKQKKSNNSLDENLLKKFNSPSFNKGIKIIKRLLLKEDKQSNKSKKVNKPKQEDKQSNKSKKVNKPKQQGEPPNNPESIKP